MVYKYDRKKEKDIDQRRDSFARRNFRIHFSSHRKRQLLFCSVPLSAQLYLYRSFFRVGYFHTPPYCSKTGCAIFDGHISTSYSVVHFPLRKIFYFLAADRYKISMVSLLFTNAFYSDTCSARCTVPRKA